MFNLDLIFPLQHDTVPPPPPLCAGLLPPGEPFDVSHTQQQAERGAGESAEPPLTQLHLPPGLHLSGEEQRACKPQGLGSIPYTLDPRTRTQNCCSV